MATEETNERWAGDLKATRQICARRPARQKLSNHPEAEYGFQGGFVQCGEASGGARMCVPETEAPVMTAVKHVLEDSQFATGVAFVCEFYTTKLVGLNNLQESLS
jgi:hypothetical protein